MQLIHSAAPRIELGRSRSRTPPATRTPTSVMQSGSWSAVAAPASVDAATPLSFSSAMQQLKDKLDDDMEVGYFLYHGTSLRETLDDLSARAKREKEDAFANGAQAADTALITENATLRLQVAHFTRIIQSAQATHPLQSQSTMSLAQDHEDTLPMNQYGEKETEVELQLMVDEAYDEVMKLPLAVGEEILSQD